MKRGTQTGSMEYSNAKRRKMQAKKRMEEKEWAKKCGPVIIRRIDEPTDTIKS